MGNPRWWSKLKFRGHHIEFTTYGLVDRHHNQYIDIAVEISFLSGLQAEILILLVWRPPYWIFHFRFGRTSFILVPLDCLTPKTWEVSKWLEFRFYLPYRSWDLGEGNHPPRHFGFSFVNSRGITILGKYFRPNLLKKGYPRGKGRGNHPLCNPWVNCPGKGILG